MQAMLDPEDFYLESGLMVLTERYHRKRGICCGNGCRHCPFDHVAVPRRFQDPEPPVEELPLLGGDVTEGVVRAGATVRRPYGPGSPAVHALLRHLHRAGFVQAPRPLGIDARGREVLTFLPGEAAGSPLHRWAATDGVLVEIARMQRRLHDAAAGFVLPAGIGWPVPLAIEGVPPLFDGEPETIGHLDLTPENLIFADGRLTGLIDFDLAAPATRLLDVACAVTWWAPLFSPADRDTLLQDANVGARLRRYVDVYGCSAHDRALLLGVAERRYERSWHVMRRRAELHGGGWARMWRAGVGDTIERSLSWLRTARPELERHLT